MVESSNYITVEHEAHALSRAVVLALMSAVLDRGLPFRFRARGSSMQPFIRDGDILTIAPVETGDVRVGDIIAFRQEVNAPRVLIHRIVARQNSRWLLRGDNALVADGEVDASDILGRVVRIERGSRKVRMGSAIFRHFISWLSNRGQLTKLVYGIATCHHLLRPVKYDRK